MKLHTQPFYRLLLALFGVIQLLGTGQVSHAQDEPILIFSAGNLRNLYWSPDSSILVFHRGEGTAHGAVLARGEYFTYDIRSGNLNSNIVWPLQPTLTAQEIETYRPIRSADDYLPLTGAPDVMDEFMFLSPDDRFMVYVTGTDPRERRFSIADRGAVAAKTLDVLAGNTGETDAFFTLWSADSRSIVIGNNPLLGDSPRYFYVTDYADNVLTATIEQITLNTVVNEREYLGAVVQDISRDGQALLIMTADLARREAGELEYFTSALYRLSETPPVLEIFENNRVSDRRLLVSPSAFDPSDERYLVALREDGLQRYNTIANTWEMLNPDVTSPASGRAIFSPDGRYLAIQSFRLSGGQVDVYVIDLSEVPPPPAQAIQLQFAEVPSEVLVNNPLPAIQVLVTDLFGSAAPFVTVTLSLGNNSAGAVLSGTLTATTNETGVATFTELSINQTGGYTLLATVDGVTTLSAAFTVVSPISTPTPTPTCTTNAADPAGLVSAITAANANGASPDTICLTNSSYTFLTAQNSIALPSITTPITIIGSGAILERGNGAPQFRAFNVTASGSLTLQNLTIRNFSAAEQGGAVFSQTGNFNAQNNWWGSASGPTGAMVNSQVQAAPFLTAGCLN